MIGVVIRDGALSNRCTYLPAPTFVELPLHAFQTLRKTNHLFATRQWWISQPERI